MGEWNYKAVVYRKRIERIRGTAKVGEYPRNEGAMESVR